MALLRIEPGIMIWTWITFILVLVVLGGATWKTIIKGLNARADKIQSDLDAAEKIKEDAKKSLTAYRTQIDNAKQESSAIIESARLEANRVRDKIISEAQIQIEQNRVKLMGEISRAEADALSDVKTQAVDMAVVMAESILRRQITEKDHKSLINEFIEAANKENRS